MSNFDRPKLRAFEARHSPPDERVVAEARRWADLIAERDLTFRERERFEAWLCDPAHEDELIVALEIPNQLAEVPGC